MYLCTAFGIVCCTTFLLGMMWFTKVLTNVMPHTIIRNNILCLLYLFVRLFSIGVFCRSISWVSNPPRPFVVYHTNHPMSTVFSTDVPVLYCSVVSTSQSCFSCCTGTTSSENNQSLVVRLLVYID